MVTLSRIPWKFLIIVIVLDHRMVLFFCAIYLSQEILICGKVQKFYHGLRETFVQCCSESMRKIRGKLTEDEHLT